MQRYFGTILFVVGLLAAILGTLGFHEAAIDPRPSWLTSFYCAMQLFYWNSSFPFDVPWTLEFARWLAPLTTFGALLKFGLVVFRKRWDRFRARRMHDHVVICGAGEKGSVLAGDLRERDTPLIIIDHDAARTEELSDDGAIALWGDATEAEVHRHGASHQAARLVIATGNDHRNLAIAMAAAQRGARSIHAYCSDASLCDLYQRNHALTSSATTVRIFNHERNLARATLQTFPPDATRGEVHVVLPDLSPLGGALAVQYALMGHFPDDRGVHLHVVRLDASRALAAFEARYPGLGACLTTTAHDLPAPELFSAYVSALVLRSEGTFTIFPGLADEGPAFSRSLELLESLPGDRIRLLLFSPFKASPLRSVVAHSPGLAKHIEFLPPHSETCGYEAVIGESLDRTAREIHERWLAETKRQIDAARASGNEPAALKHEAKTTYRPWDALSEEQKGASRSQADHIAFKIRAAGLDPATVTKAAWAQVPPARIEVLSRLEHARWAAYYAMTGWTHAPERNDAHKQHPNLVPYDDLDEPTKDYDREAARNVGDYLK